MSTTSGLPENLARFRKSRNLSQEELAEAANLGVDTIGRIERGERQATRPATLRKLAQALRLPIGLLMGVASAASRYDVKRLAALRQAITASEEIPGLSDFTDDAELVPLSTLVASTHNAWRSYVAGRNAELLHDLPCLLVDARRVVHASNNDENAAAHRLLSAAYRLGSGLTGRLDLDDLAWTSAERALEAARRSDCPEIESAISLRYVAWTLVRQNRTDEAERVAVRAAERIEPRMLDRDPARAGVFGNLLFNGAVAALWSGKSARAADLLTVAHSAAIRSGVDTASEAAIFGPRVAGLQLVEQAYRTGDPDSAFRLAESVPRSQGQVPAFWEAGHRLILAASAVQLHKDKLALDYLAEARDLAPEWSRHQPLGRSTMRALVDRAARRQTKRFAELAAHYSIV